MLQEDDVLPRATESPFLSVLHANNDTTNIFGYKLGESTENNKALLFFSGKETIQNFNRCMYRGYYMAARRYEISLRVFKNIFEIFFSTREEKFRISKRPCNVLFII